jgi:hypothetical protein
MVHHGDRPVCALPNQFPELGGAVGRNKPEAKLEITEAVVSYHGVK